jgi:hypothetical protein
MVHAETAYHLTGHWSGPARDDHTRGRPPLRAGRSTPGRWTAKDYRSVGDDCYSG